MKKKLIAENRLSKYGKPNENTPGDWVKSYVDLRSVKCTALQCVG